MLKIFILLIFCLLNCQAVQEDDQVFQGEKGLCSVKEAGSLIEKPCQFPFIYDNETYYGCTLKDTENGEPWCSTKTDPLTYEHITKIGAYGDCDDSCPSDQVGKNDFDEYAEQSNSLYANESEALSAIRVSLEFGVRTTGKIYEDCQCATFKQCNWSNNQLNRINRLSKNSASRRGQVKYFRDRICDFKDRTVYCCSGQTAPRTNAHLSFLRALKDLPVDFSQSDKPSRPSTTARPRDPKNNKESGQWRPSGDKGECGTTTTISNIVGGSITKLGDFPYMALLGYDVFGQIYYTCGGSLINKWYVLTAAHCVQDTQGPLSEIVLGEHVVGKDPDCKKGRRQCAPRVIKRKIGKITRHENFGGAPGFENDIALIRLAEAVPLFADDASESNAMPVCLPWNRNDPGRGLSEGDRMIITGWGRITNNRRQATAALSKFRVSTRTLRKLTVPVANNECTSRDAFNINRQKQMCAGGQEGADSCNGDSGGPIAYREFSDDPWHQVGIVSYGTSKCGQGEPGVYTKIEGYLDWIAKHLEP